MENKGLLFGIDVDGVLRNLVPQMVGLYNKELGQSLKVNNVTDFKVEHSFPAIKEQTGKEPSYWFFQEHGSELFRESPIINGAKSAVDTLKTFGKIIIVTYQKSIQNKIDTLCWLDDNGIDYDGICFAKDKSLVQFDYLIDDNDWNFIGCKCRKGILIDAPYNKDVDTLKLTIQSYCDSIHRFSSLTDFVNWYQKTGNKYDINSRKF